MTILGMPWYGALFLALLVAGTIAGVMYFILQHLSSARRERVRTQQKRLATTVKTLTVMLPLDPNPTVFVNEATGFRGAIQVHGQIHLYLEDTTGAPHAQSTGGSLLPRVVIEGRGTGYMPIRPLSPTSFHGMMNHPGLGVEGSLDFNQALTILDKPVEVDNCAECTKLKQAVDVEVARLKKEAAAKAAAAEAEAATTAAPTA